MGSMEDNLFTYEVEIANAINIPCDLKKEDESGRQKSLILMMIWNMIHLMSNLLNEGPSKEFNYLLQIDPNVLTKDIDGFKTYEEYKDDWIYEWNKDVPWDGKLKEEALKNKAIMDGMIEEDDESSNEGWKRWDEFDNTNHDNEE
ncbi:hypothetical protein Tco_0577005 [Tanacetum coccineum]